jgi:hypothetical protein
MARSEQELSKKSQSGTASKSKPKQAAQDVRTAQQWGGGSKGSKGGITAADKRNPNSSAKS